MKSRLDETLKPGGYNIGINVGEVSGQTVGHVHVHLIPRYAGDVADPVGGVRNIIPGRGRYPGPTQQQQ
jgi:diadenosine tetraphosphate (Ap4A) HIT family hydrolase